MKTNRLIWALGWVTMGSLAALQGCGGDDDDGGTGTGGKGGSSGSAGKGGTSGSAGKGGASGSAGKGGASGSAGKGGTSGTSGTSGAGGAPGGVGGEGGEDGGGDRYAVCSEYCQLYQDKDCEDSDADTYGDEATFEPICRSTCMDADWPIGTRGAGAGDTIHCRLTHAGLADAPAPDPDELHCGHASAEPTGVCI